MVSKRVFNVRGKGFIPSIYGDFGDGLLIFIAAFTATAGSLFDILRPVCEVEGGPGGRRDTEWSEEQTHHCSWIEGEIRKGNPGAFCGVFSGKSDVCPWFSMMFTIQRHTKPDF